MNKPFRFQAFAGPKPGTGAWFEVKDEATSDAAEILIYDRIGKDWWSGEGVEAKKFCEELSKIPQSREITLRINSGGGSVHDGMLIYNRLAERRDKLTVKVDGIAASIASVIMLAGRQVVIPKNALVMIHDPWGFVEGNSEEMRKAADMLDKHRDAIMSVYIEKTGKDEDEVKGLMTAETWFTGQEAVDAGFADSVSAEEVAFEACFDYSRFRRVPEQLRAEHKKSEKQQKENRMNRETIIAELKKRGIKFTEDATTEALAALLETTPQAGQQNLPLDPPPAPRNAPAQAPSAGVPASPSADLEVLQRQVANLQASRDGERKLRIEREVDKCVAEDRIPATQRDKWVARAMADESVLEDIQAMAPKPPGSEPVRLTVEAEEPRDIERGILALRQPIESFRRGNSVPSVVLQQNAVAMAREIGRHRKRLDHILNANTVAPELKRNVILSDMMRDFKRKLLMLSIFSTSYNNIPLQGTDKISVPFYDLDTTTSNNFAAATGYLFDHDTTTGKKEITINKRKYKPMTFSSSEIMRQPYFNPPRSLMLMGEQLAVDVWTDVLSVVVDTNFSGQALNEGREPASFDLDDLIAIAKQCDDTDWPEVGRTAVLGTGHKMGLLQDDSVKLALNIGSTEPIRDGTVGRLAGFDLVWSPRIPTNSQDLQGFVCFPSAVLFASSPIAPAPGVRATLLSYDIVTDPDTGIAFEYRYWGEAQMDKDREVIECNYGYAAGVPRALLRLTGGATGFSSSSSASSVNSSSSSSSSASF